MDTITCEFCGTPTPKSHWNKRFCSRDCKDKQARADGRNSLATRKFLLKRNYGIDYETYRQMEADQGGACAICGRDEPVGRKARYEPMWLHVDHDHDTGKVRGLLCGECNMGLGKFQHDPELLHRAISYLDHPMM